MTNEIINKAQELRKNDTELFSNLRESSKANRKALRESRTAAEKYDKATGLESQSFGVDQFTVEAVKAVRDQARKTYKGAKANQLDASNAYNGNLAAATEHYEENADTYHQQALKEATEAGVDVNFQGDAAKNVKPKKEQFTWEEPPVPVTAGSSPDKH